MAQVINFIAGWLSVCVLRRSLPQPADRPAELPAYIWESSVFECAWQSMCEPGGLDAEMKRVMEGGLPGSFRGAVAHLRGMQPSPGLDMPVRLTRGQGVRDTPEWRKDAAAVAKALHLVPVFLPYGLAQVPTKVQST